MQLWKTWDWKAPFGIKTWSVFKEKLSSDFQLVNAVSLFLPGLSGVRSSTAIWTTSAKSCSDIIQNQAAKPLRHHCSSPGQGLAKACNPGKQQQAQSWYSWNISYSNSAFHFSFFFYRKIQCQEEPTKGLSSGIHCSFPRHLIEPCSTSTGKSSCPRTERAAQAFLAFPCTFPMDKENVRAQRWKGADSQSSQSSKPHQICKNCKSWILTGL